MWPNNCHAYERGSEVCDFRRLLLILLKSPAKIMFLQATNGSCSAAARHVTRTTVSVDNLTVVLTVGMRNFSAGIVVYFPSSYIIRYHLKKHGNF